LLSSDKVVNEGECLKYRPDFVFAGEKHYVILEVDENQHRNYEELCECTRMKNIAEELR
jgi:hypothetical protein